MRFYAFTKETKLIHNPKEANWNFVRWICQFQSLGNLDWISFHPFRSLGRGNQFFARPSDSSGLANGFLQAVPTPRDWQMDFCKAFRRLGNHDQIFFLQFRHLGKGEWVFVWHSDASGKTNGFLQAIPTHREGQIEFVLPSPGWIQTRAYLK